MLNVYKFTLIIQIIKHIFKCLTFLKNSEKKNIITENH